MFFLAIESSTKTLSIALFKDKKLVQEILQEPNGKTHSEKLLPLIDQLLSHHQILLTDLGHIAVAIGPGAYTSLRVGLATVMGLAQTNNIPVVPVSSLCAMAWGAKKEGELTVPLLKAGRGYVYAAGYRYVEGKLKEEVAENIYEPTIFFNQIKFPSPLTGEGRGEGEIFCIGPGCELLSKTHSFKADPSFIPKASFVGELAIAQNIPAIPPTTLQVRYLQGLDNLF